MSVREGRGHGVVLAVAKMDKGTLVKQSTHPRRERRHAPEVSSTVGFRLGGFIARV